MVEWVYTFKVLEYLKGEGAEEVALCEQSAPKYNAFPNWFGYRTEEEARALQETERRAKESRITRPGEGILFIYSAYGGEEDRVGWEGCGSDGSVELLPMDWAATISEETLRKQIEDMASLDWSGFENCVSSSLHWRERVKSQLEGAYRELTLGGYREPDPFPRFIVESEADESGMVRVYSSSKLPAGAPRFSDYWLAGADKELFVIDTHMHPDTSKVYEELYSAEALPEGEYSVIAGQYHESIPCGPPWTNLSWWEVDIREWVIRVTASETGEG